MLVVMVATLAVAATATWYFTRRSDTVAVLLAQGPLLETRSTAKTPTAPTSAADAPAQTQTPPSPPTATDLASTKAAGADIANKPPLKLAKTRTLKPRFKVAFKGAFGGVVTTRTYASKAMKLRAQALWNREGKILEPDGSVLVPYEKPAPPAASLIPGH